MIIQPAWSGEMKLWVREKSRNFESFHAWQTWCAVIFPLQQEYQQENRGDINGVFHEQLLGVLCNLTAVSLSKANIFDCMEVLHK